MARYDAFLLLSFGGPEGRDDVIPFLRNVAAGRDIPERRLAEVAEHYYQFGGVSPINGQCRDLLAAIGKRLTADGQALPVYWGNRNSQPYLADTLRQMAADGVRRAVAVATSAYSSYSSCRQYLEDIELARAQAGPGAPVVDKIPPFFWHPGFTGSFSDAARDALESLPEALRDEAGLVFVAHSVPAAMSAASGPDGGAYPRQLAAVARQVAAALGRSRWRLAYCSRSGPPSVPWLEPDISDCLTELAQDGAAAAVVVPIGFVSDHMEVRYDLDVVARATAERLGLPLARAATPGTGARFVTMIAELVRACQEAGLDGPGGLGGLDGPGGLGGLGSLSGPGADDVARFCAANCCGASQHGPR